MLAEIGSTVVLGLIEGSIFALIAIGFTMIFGVGGVLNLAHGALIMAGAYAYLSLTKTTVLESLVVPEALVVPVLGVGIPVPLPQFSIDLSVHPVVAFPLTIAIVAVLSYGLYIGLVRYIEENVVITFLATVVVALAFTEYVLWFFNSQPHTFNLASGAINLDAIGLRVFYNQILAVLAAWLAIVLLWYYVTQTDGGRSILATSMSERGAKLTGVDVGSVHAKTWLIAGGLAGLAGVFLGATQATEPGMWLTPLGLAFIIVVIGGIGSIKGSILAAYLIGFLQAGTAEFYAPKFQSILPLIVLVGVLLLRPEGLFGREFVHE